MRSQTMPLRDIHQAHAGQKALGRDPGFRLIRPAPISTRPLHNLDAAIKTVPAVRHCHPLETSNRNSLLPQRNGTAEINATETAFIMIERSGVMHLQLEPMQSAYRAKFRGMF